MELTIEQALQKGTAAHNAGNLQEAERVYQAILSSHPKHPDTNHNLGLLAILLNNVDFALPLFKTAIEQNSKIEQYWLSYIDALMVIKEFKQAKRVVKKAKKAGFTGKNLKAVEGRLLRSREGRINPPSVELEVPSETQINTLWASYQNGYYGDSENLARLITQQFPVHQFAWKVLGALLKKTGRISEALVASQASVRLGPQDAEEHCNLGDLLQQLDRLEEAEGVYRQAIVLKPTYAEAHCNLGQTLQELGRSSEAELSLRQAIVLKSDLSEAHNNLGNTLKDLGRLEEAEAGYTEAIELKPDFAEALMNRWQLLFDDRKFDAALRDVDLCNTQKSRACGLETLYALGRIDEIYKRIEIYSKSDDENIRMAAFSAFISEREKKETAHKFCPKPLSLIHFSNVSFYHKDSTKFLREIISELGKIETIWEPTEKTTHKGFQTNSSINLFISTSEKIAQLQSIILDELDVYYSKFRQQSCSYIKNWPSKKILCGWHVVLKQQGYQSPHIHSSGWLSGVIYLKLVPSLGKNEGAIEFSLNSETYSDLKSSTLTYQPELGDIVFFPSSLHHRTVPFTTDTDRVVISFDLMPEIAGYEVAE